MNHMNISQCIFTAGYIVSFVSRAMVSYVVINLACSSKEILQQRSFRLSSSAMQHRPARNKVSATAHNSRPESASGFCCIPNGSFSRISVCPDRRQSVQCRPARRDNTERAPPPPPPPQRGRHRRRPAQSGRRCTGNLVRAHICIHEHILCFRPASDQP